MKNSEKLVKFIKENKLLFNTSGSALNSECTIISGFADYLGIDDENTIIGAIKTARPKSKEYEKELSRVFNFCYTSNYGAWWSKFSPEAHKMYKF